MSIKTVYFLLFAGLLVILCHSCQKGDAYSPNDPEVDNTTIGRTIVPDPVKAGEVVLPWEVAKFPANNYGNWHYGPGTPYAVMFNLMPDGYTRATPAKRSKLLRFFTLTDVHLTDKESPAQSIYYSIFFNQHAPGSFASTISCYSPAMLYSTHVLNASVQTINKLHSQSPVDFGISLGDMGNSSMYNETRWFIDILDGKNINPDSGAKDDPVAGPGNDYQDTYKAEGLSKSIPWYATVGNHDHFFMGAQPFNEKVRNNLLGGEIIQLGNIFTDANALNLNTFSMGTLDGRTVYGDIIGASIVAEKKIISTIPADQNRHALTKDQMMKEFSNTTSNPVGHGFNQPNFFDGCYSFEPKANLPLKVIVLDDTMTDNDYNPDPAMMGGYGTGTLAHGRFEWLKQQLQDGQKEDKLMIIAAHIPIGVEEEGSFIGWSDTKAQTDILNELHKYPNFILWVAGHRHLDEVNAFPSASNEPPENGFWEVETRSLREFPQQFRTFDIKWNGDQTISIFATDVDPIVENNAMATRSRSLAIAANQTFKTKQSNLSTNVELVKKLTPRMEAKISAYVSATVK